MKKSNRQCCNFYTYGSNVETVIFYVSSGKEALEKPCLIIDERDISTDTAAETSAKIKGNDFIYVMGGNTFFLLQERQRAGADKIIIEEVNVGKLDIVESARELLQSQILNMLREWTA